MSNNSYCVLFDWDGTVVPGFTLLPWTNFLKKNNLFPAHSSQEIKALFHAYNHKEISHEELCSSSAQAYAQGLKGGDSIEIEVAAGKYIKQCAPPIHLYAVELFSYLKKHGISNIVISGAPAVILREYVKLYPLDQVFGLELLSNEQAVLTGKLSINPGLMKDKELIVKSLSQGTKVLYALGNSISDLPLFEAAERGILIEGCKDIFPHTLSNKLSLLTPDDVIDFVKSSYIFNRRPHK